MLKGWYQSFALGHNWVFPGFLLQKKPCFWNGMQNELTGSLGWGKVPLQKEGMEFVTCPFPRMSIGLVTAMHGAVLCASLRSSQIWFCFLKKCIPYCKRSFFLPLVTARRAIACFLCVCLHIQSSQFWAQLFPICCDLTTAEIKIKIRLVTLVTATLTSYDARILWSKGAHINLCS